MLLALLAATSCALPSHARASELDPRPQRPNIFDSRRGIYWSVAFEAGTIEYGSIERMIQRFQSDNEFSGSWGLKTSIGVSRNSNVVEAELSFGGNSRSFMYDNDISINVSNSFLWYRRSLPFSLGGIRARVLPGAGVGHSYARAMVGNEDSGYNILYASDISYVLGLRAELILLSKKREYASTIYYSIHLDYKYRIDDMEGTFVNEGEVFFLEEPAFDLAGHYFSIGLIMGWAR